MFYYIPINSPVNRSEQKSFFLFIPLLIKELISHIKGTKCIYDYSCVLKGNQIKIISLFTKKTTCTFYQSNTIEIEFFIMLCCWMKKPWGAVFRLGGFRGWVPKFTLVFWKYQGTFRGGMWFRKIVTKSNLCRSYCSKNTTVD